MRPETLPALSKSMASFTESHGRFSTAIEPRSPRLAMSLLKIASNVGVDSQPFENVSDKRQLNRASHNTNLYPFGSLCHKAVDHGRCSCIIDKVDDSEERPTGCL
ncbi:unnamed protein product [Clonostachys rosea f. rosea IK726]|uniref:Uncharacterized protein n=1 Tax=Clonostachys rosea f. rosea IK726 TaxID=1349383 RepID=A0ACA9U6Z9_BIOOC|nr:unnamed protein product [Clonostachys rosea f. rosea IK726]